jgi:2-polyprenyl-6-methoxyphenol hydroxylase-like FAD-dependent oxidoreductase
VLAFGASRDLTENVPVRVIVVGGSIAGLLAARAVSEFATDVSIVERDVPPAVAAPRKGVPQGRHVHGVLASGLDVLKDLFPDILVDLTSDGARVADTGDDVRWFNNGSWRLRCNCGVTSCVLTRPLLELHIRKRVEKILNVKQLCGHSVTGLEMDQTKSRITGVRIEGTSGTEKVLPADLVVDCSGRGSKTPSWLEALGLSKPQTTMVTVNIGYSTAFFHVPDKTGLDWQAMLILSQPPKGTRLGACFFVESGELQVTLGGQFRDYPPDNEPGFLEFAATLETPELFRTIQHAIPASPISTYRFPAHLRHHYERLRNGPSNLLVLGDALCSFNPIYGQGMSVAALEARVLHRCLADTSSHIGGTSELRNRYFQEVSRVVNAAWTMATGADLAYPQAEGKRPFGQAVILGYLGQIIALSCCDKRVLTVWNQVTNMQKPLSALFSPSIAARVMRRAILSSD